jgi:adenylate cyclase
VSRRRLRTLLLVATAVTAFAAAAGLQATDVLRRLELDTIGARFGLRGTEPRRKDIVIVAVDGTSIAAVGDPWPFRRRIVIKVLNRLARAGAAVVACDFQITGSKASDEAFLAAVSRSRGFVLGTGDRRNGRPVVLGGDARRLRAVGGVVGDISAWARDPGGVLWRMRDAMRGSVSFPLAVAEEKRRHAIGRTGFRSGAAWVDYRGRAGTFPTVSFSDFLYSQTVPSVRGKIAIVGTTDPSSQDIHPAPPSGDPMSGPEIEANAIQTVLDGVPLRDVPWWANLAIAGCLVLLVLAVSLRFSGLAALLVAFGGVGAYAVACQLVFQGGRILEFVNPVCGVVLAGAGAGVVDYFTETRERRRTRALFMRYVPEGVVDAVLERTDEDLRLGAEALDATVLFCDLRGFTAFAESHDAEQVMALLNRYHTEAGEAVRAHRGTLVSFMGDGLLAVFGAPLEQSDHADRALAAAREILGQRLPSLNRWALEKALVQELRIGIGLASGQVMSGNIGASWRVEYAAVGDTTNVAARLQDATKEVGVALLVADSTRDRLSNPDELTTARDLELRGRTGQVRAWTDGAPTDP